MMWWLMSLCFGFTLAQEGVRLAQYNIDKSQISVSGLSSGGGFSTQFHVVHSASIMGSAPFAGAPYNCFARYDGQCTFDPDAVDVNVLVRDAQEFARNGDIDPTSNIGRAKVFVLTGTEDFFVDAGAGRKIVEFYQQFGADVVGEFSLQSGHGFPTLEYGSDCAETWIPGINRCNYNGAYMALNQIYGGGLRNPGSSTDQPGEFISFDQLEFRDAVLETASFDPIGYLYVPEACQDRQTACRLHINFHGCFQGRDSLIVTGDEYARNTGYNEVAELNNIIIMHPQIIPTDDNPGGCWDWNGLDSQDYQTKRGAHVRIVKSMLDRLTG